jgi:hypothetical protein
MKKIFLIFSILLFSVSAKSAEYENGEQDISKVLQTWTGDPQIVWAQAMGGVCVSKLECLRLAALAYEETRFAAWAVDQSCNDSEWRKTHKKDKVCDSGKAFGPWQVQDERFRGASPEFQASVSLEMMRRYPESWTTKRKAWQRADAWVNR